MPWTAITTRSTGYLFTASNFNDVANDLNFLAEINYTEFTSNVTVNATTVGTANQVVSSGAITYEAVPTMIEFYAPRYTGPASASFFILRDGSTVLGTLAGPAISSTVHPFYAAARRTPTAASHTYNVAAWVSSGSGTVLAGAGGTAGDQTTYLPGFIRVTRLPT